MRKKNSAGRTARTVAIALAVLAGEAAIGSTPEAPAGNAATVAFDATNPFFAPSTLPMQAPDFGAIREEHFLPAILAGMAQQIQEVEAIARSPEAPSVENTLVALERSGQLLTRVSNVFSNLSSTDSSERIRAIESEVSPLLSDHQDRILMNPGLFGRVKALYEARDTIEVDPETLRLIEETYGRFVRAGADLPEATQARIRALNAEEASLRTAFKQALLAQTTSAAVVIDRVEDLDGLSAGEIEAAAEAAREAGHEGKWVVRITNTTRQPVLASLTNREVRQRIWEASASRGLAEGEGDTRAMVIRLARLRAELAGLLGKPTWAAYKLQDQMAGTPEAVLKMLSDLAPTVMETAAREAAAIQEIIDAEGGSFDVEPWDWEYYAEKVRRARYDLDMEEVKPYFEVNRVLEDGVFFAFQRFYGVTFRERTDLPVYHPDVRVFDVIDADGSEIGLFYADYFARPSKRGGAWMSNFVEQSTLLGQKPVVVNVMNIPAPAEGQPALMSFDHVVTMFHELGHGVHGLFSQARYPSLAGTNVPRDFVEFPSQFEEDWAKHPEVLRSYARHHETGDVIPQALMDKVLRASAFNQGFDTLEYLAASFLDMAWHTIDADAEITDVEGFERSALLRFGVWHPAVPPRYRSAFFAHVFSGGYSSGYYAYIWSEVLAADAFAYVQAEGGLSRAVGDAYRREVISRGGTRDPMAIYVDWRGQEPDPVHLLRRRGLLSQSAE